MNRRYRPNQAYSIQTIAYVAGPPFALSLYYTSILISRFVSLGCDCVDRGTFVYYNADVRAVTQPTESPAPRQQSFISIRLDDPTRIDFGWPGLEGGNNSSPDRKITSTVTFLTTPSSSKPHLFIPSALWLRAQQTVTDRLILWYSTTYTSWKFHVQFIHWLMFTKQNDS